MDQDTTPHVPQNARNFFFYFLNFALLYTVAINLGGVLFNIIDKSFPLVGGYYGGGGMRFNLSALIIGSPIFLWLAMKIYRDEGKDQTMLRSGIRRWLTYITLIVTALIVIGDLIALVNNLLGGETTTRFILKALVVLGISGGVFSFYFADVRQQRSAEQPKMMLPRLYYQSSIVIILVVIVSGFFFIESPVLQRQRNQDNARINNLTQIENAIYQYASINDAKLPVALIEVTLPEGVVNDPVTGEPITYQVVSNTNFKLCANFETSNREKTTEPTYYPDTTWLHDKGTWCFERSLDQYLNANGIPFKPAPL